MEEKRFYTYRWYNVDTNETFYIGKGCGKRLNVLQGRSRTFMEYYNNHKCVSEIIKDNMTEQEAYAMEKELIKQCKSSSLCNLDEGGRKLGIFCGKDNPMYKVTPKDRMSPEVYAKWYAKHKEYYGEKNANYGKHTLLGRKQSKEHIAHRSGEHNGRAKKIVMATPQGEVIKEFGCKLDCCKYLVEHNIDYGDYNNMRHRINWAMSKNRLYLGYNFYEK